MPHPTRRSILAAGTAGTLAAGVAACSNSGSSTQNTGGGATGNFEERGPITFATGKDTSGKLKEFLEK